ncbi:DMT family transporter [Simkania sp.]|uniref:DMT family transporter n=1 Tax=Simkania sp. TaxID=34094 RepID=UPI003B5210A7
MSTPSKPPASRSFTLFWLWISILIFAASNAVVAKIGELGAMHPTASGHNPISFCNLFFTGNLLAGITLLIVYRKNWRLSELKQVSLKMWICMFVLILFAGVLAPAFYFIALMLTEVTNVVLISTIDVPLSLFFAYLFFREKARPLAILGALIAFGGIILIFLLNQPPMENRMTMKMIDVGNPAVNQFLQTLPKGGEILTTLATLMTIIATQISRSLLRSVSVGVYSVLRMMVGVVLFSIIVMSVFGVHHFDDLFSPFLWGWMIVYGALIIVVGQIMWYKGVKKASSADISMATALTPIAGTLFAYLILGEVPNKAQIIGGIVILFGIGVSLFGELRAKRRKVTHERPGSFEGI